MSKPQLAAEPSMEEILASIRKLISDDRPGPSPMPDPMSRGTVGSPARAPMSGMNGHTNGHFSTPAHEPRPTGPAPFNSLADALKVATALSDQRRSLQQDVISALDRSARAESSGAVDVAPNRALSRLDNVHRLPEPSSPQAVSDVGGPRLPSFPEWRSGPAAAEMQVEKRDLLSFDFGTVIPKREPLAVKSPAAAIEARLEAEKIDPRPANGSDQDAIEGTPLNGSPAETISTTAVASAPMALTPVASAPDAPAPIAVAAEQRVLSMSARTSSTGQTETNGAHIAASSLNGSAMNGAPFNGTAQHAVASLVVNGGTVAPFPRPLREALKSVTEPFALQPHSNSAENIVELQPATQPATKESAADAKPLERGQPGTEAASQSAEARANGAAGKGESAPVKAAAPATPSDAAAAKADALLDAVVDLVQKQPGALSVFTSGSSFISGVGAKKMLEEAASAAAAQGAQTGAPPKLDRAAAELLRPMLRQWLADNMPRIVEEALRSELTAQTEGSDPTSGNA